MAEPPEAVMVEVRCTRCDRIIRLPVGELRCAAADRTGGLCEFRCPACQGLVLRAVEDQQDQMLREAGAGVLSAPVPFELLEPHDGPVLTFDDLLDLHLALEATDRPQEELGD